MFRRQFGFVGFVGVYLALLFPAEVIASLQVFPTRVLLTDTRRISQVSVRHHGSKPQRYTIAPVFFRMNGDGSLSEVTTPDKNERFGGDIIRYSPREVVLTPGLEQVVRIMVIPKTDLSTGDYRLHLRFTPVPEADEEALASRSESRPGKAVMNLRANVAIAIPVVFRHGQAKPNVKLDKLLVNKRPDGSYVYSVDLKSEGNAFPFGTLRATLLKQGETLRQIGLVKGISSYRDRRTASYPLEISSLDQLAGHTLRLDYVAPEEDGGSTLASIDREF